MKLSKKSLIGVMLIPCMMLGMVGCSNKGSDKSNTATNTDAVVSEDGFSYSETVTTATDADGSTHIMLAKEQTSDAYADDVASMTAENPDVMGWEFTYNGTKISYPFDYSVFMDDGWTSDSNSTSSLLKLSNSGYSNQLSISSYSFDDTGVGIAGKADTLKQYGVYDFTLSCDAVADDSKFIDLKINGTSLIGNNVNAVLSACGISAVGTETEDGMFYSDVKKDSSGMNYEIRIMTDKNNKVTCFDFYTYGKGQLDSGQTYEK